MNYFELLDIDQQYDIDQALLTKQYLQKQILYHPDKARSDVQRKDYLEKSMRINEAYKSLKDDYLRAEYLLKLQGQEFTDSVLKDKLSPTEIEEIIEQQEIVMDMDNIEELQAFYQDQIDSKNVLISALTIAFEENNIVKALDLTIRLKYLTNLVKNIKLKIKHADSRNF